MVGAPFHLGWFTGGFKPPSWNTTWCGSSNYDWVNAEFFVDLARSCERAKFDLVLYPDAAWVSYDYGGTAEMDLKYSILAPQNDPAALMPVLAYTTSRIGLAPTISTTEWLPFQVARYIASVDHLSGGRVGWNIVTGGSTLSAMNYGSDAPLSHDERYDMADEFVEIACRLWDSWEPDAVVLDYERGVYADHTKVHPINFEGKYFSCRGPAVTARPPQGRPVLIQAGASPRGRAFAAKHADLVATTARTVEDLKQYRDDIRARVAESGGDPDECKVMFLVSPIVSDTDEEAYERQRGHDAEDARLLEYHIADTSMLLNVDLSGLDPDSPVPADMRTEYEASLLDQMIASGKPLRELVTNNSPGYGFDLVGSPDTVAGKMAELMQEVGGDGFLIGKARIDRRYVTEIVDGLVPALQRRGLVRKEYEHTHLRDHLMEF